MRLHVLCTYTVPKYKFYVRLLYLYLYLYLFKLVLSIFSSLLLYCYYTTFELIYFIHIQLMLCTEDSAEQNKE